jgi:polysaccharide deacetylase family protein (PEP-CTERM system associated)
MENLKSDLKRSKKLLEDITGSPIYGYRAPSFSISHDILKIIEDSGYLYDSSFNSYKLNKRYGQLKISGISPNGISIQISNGFYELPVSNLKIRRRIVPWGGGGYFRVVPFHLFRLGVQSILAGQNTYLFYLHPWEIDTNQPRVSGVSKFFKFRQYVNLDKTYGRLSALLEFFKEYRFSTCVQYINRESQQTQ